MSDKNKIMLDWLLTCPNVSRLYALFGDVKDGAQHLYRQSDGTLIQRKYIDGTRFEQAYSDWQLLCFNTVAFNWQPATGSENLNEYENAQAICDWIETQRKAHNYPPFKEEVEDIEALPKNPQTAGVDSTGIAKYMIGIRVTFKGALVT